MEFKIFVKEIEDLVDGLFHGALNLGNNEHFSDLVGDGTGDDTRLYWEDGLKEIYNKVKG
ncbi:MAG: hypothetical protein ACE5K4_10995 [Candidatus Hydrothermarchaeota archaeon]